MSIEERAAILVVEDNRDLALGLRVNLEDAGYRVHVAHTVGDGLARMRQFTPDLLILDLGLPDGDGLQLTRQLRAGNERALILLLTANTQHETKLRGLRDGADDYVTKPFDLEELLVRVDVLLRRRQPRNGAPISPPPDEVFEFADVEVDTRAREIRKAGVAVAVSRIGFDLLLMLLRHRGSVVTRAELMREVWGYSETVSSRTLDTHIFDLRKELEADPGEPKHIKTVWRIGYRFD